MDLIEFDEVEVVFAATGFGVVKSVDLHIGFADFLGPVVERVGCMDSRGHGDGHPGGEYCAVYSLGVAGSYSEYF